jgi:hypothetical protein
MVEPEETAIARQWLGKHCDNKYINTIAGHGVFYAVHVISNTYYAMKGKYVISSFKNFLLHRGSLDVITYINVFYSNRA